MIVEKTPYFRIQKETVDFPFREGTSFIFPKDLEYRLVPTKDRKRLYYLTSLIKYPEDEDDDNKKPILDCFFFGKDESLFFTNLEIPVEQLREMDNLVKRRLFRTAKNTFFSFFDLPWLIPSLIDTTRPFVRQGDVFLQKICNISKDNVSQLKTIGEDDYSVGGTRHNLKGIKSSSSEKRLNFGTVRIENKMKLTAPDHKSISVKPAVYNIAQAKWHRQDAD